MSINTLTDAEVLIINGVITLGSIFISNIFTYTSAKINYKNENNSSVSKEQYQKLYSPLHKILFFDELDYEDKFTKISTIISENYDIVPKVIREEYLNCRADNKITYSFQDNIRICFNYSSSLLGYSHEKLNKKEKKKAHDIITCKKEYSIKSRLKGILNYILLTIIIFLLANTYIIVSDSEIFKNYIEKFNDVFSIIITIGFALTFILLLVTSIPLLIAHIKPRINNIKKRFK